MNPAIGLIRVGSLDPASSDLVQGTIRLMSGENLSRDFDSDRVLPRLTLNSSGRTWFPVIGGWGDEATWDLGFNPKVALKMDLSLGVGKIEVDLTGLDMTAVEVNLGLGKTIVTLPDEGRLTVTISGAIGETYVVIPQGMAVRFHVSTGLGTSSLPSGYTRQGDAYISPGYESAEDRVEMNINQAIGMITLVELGR